MNRTWDPTPIETLSDNKVKFDDVPNLPGLNSISSIKGSVISKHGFSKKAKSRHKHLHSWPDKSKHMSEKNSDYETLHWVKNDSKRKDLKKYLSM